MIFTRWMRTGAAALALAAAAAPGARAQDGAPGEGWNGPRALELITRAQERRASTQADTGLVDYQADARGYIYFYIDVEETGERTLVKTDQVALDVYWKAPNLSKQRIVGLRDARNLPTNIRYHEDHLTVVQDNFGDLIRLGDGDEVADVLHPAAPQGPGVYEYRLADSTTIRLAGAPEPVRVYEIQVRPRDTSRPAFVGSVYVDMRQGDIVRMRFTFTPVSYVDRHLDYINVLLENGLYKGRFWLPNRQEVQLRREVPELGLPAGGVIRGTMRITNYRFNQNLPAGLFAGRRVVSVPIAQREAFAFEQTLDAELREAGLEGDVDLAEVRREATVLIGRRLLTGLPATRLDFLTASGTLRYNRAEGLAVGTGFRTSPREGVTLALRGGVSTATLRPFAEAEAWRGALPERTGLGLYLNQPRDAFAARPVISGAMNSLTALVAGYDFTDPFRASGVELRSDSRAGGGWASEVRARVERHSSAALEADFSLMGGSSHFRPVSPVDEGTLIGGSLFFRRRLPAEVGRGLGLSAGMDGGILDGDAAEKTFVRPRVDAEYVMRFSGARELLVDASAAAALGDVPAQYRYRIGGRGTVPGYAFRGWDGERFAAARATYSAELWRPFLRGRVFTAAGWADGGRIVPAPGPVVDAGAFDVAPGQGDPRDRPVLWSVGAGVGVFFDILRVDVARGLGDDGQWEVIVEANPSFWGFL